MSETYQNGQLVYHGGSISLPIVFSLRIRINIFPDRDLLLAEGFVKLQSFIVLEFFRIFLRNNKIDLFGKIFVSLGLYQIVEARGFL